MNTLFAFSTTVSKKNPRFRKYTWKKKESNGAIRENWTPLILPKVSQNEVAMECEMADTLRVGQRKARRNLKLQLHQIYIQHHLRDGVLHLASTHAHTQR